MHCGYLKLVWHDIISFWELPEKSKLQNQSCRRSSWDFITSIACLHEYLSFLTDPICHNSCLSREKEKRNGAKKIHSFKLMYNSCQCFLAWKEIRGECRKTCFLQQRSHFPFHLGCSGFDQTKPRVFYSLEFYKTSLHIKKYKRQTKKLTGASLSS